MFVLPHCFSTRSMRAKLDSIVVRIGEFLGTLAGPVGSCVRENEFTIERQKEASESQEFDDALSRRASGTF